MAFQNVKIQCKNERSVKLIWGKFTFSKCQNNCIYTLVIYKKLLINLIGNKWVISFGYLKVKV